MLYSREKIESTVKSKGYVYFEDVANKGYDVNIIGVRNSAPGGRVLFSCGEPRIVKHKHRPSVP